MTRTNANTDTPVITDETDKFDVSTLSVSNPDEVRESYATGDRSAKAAIRTFVKNAMEAAIRASDFNGAQAALDLNASLKSVADKSAKVVDYAQIVANRVASLRIAADRLESGDVHNLPEGVELDAADIRAKLGDYVETDLTDEILKSVESFATVKWGKSGRNDIAVHIAQWASTVPSGTFATVRSIAAFRSEEYGTDNPSDGAIAAHLFPTDAKYDKSDLTGVVPVERNGTVARGARKV